MDTQTKKKTHRVVYRVDAELKKLFIFILSLTVDYNAQVDIAVSRLQHPVWTLPVLLILINPLKAHIYSMKPYLLGLEESYKCITHLPGLPY